MLHKRTKEIFAMECASTLFEGSISRHQIIFMKIEAQNKDCRKKILTIDNAKSVDLNVPKNQYKNVFAKFFTIKMKIFTYT